MLICLVEPQVYVARKLLAKSMADENDWKALLRTSILKEHDGRESAVLEACKAVETMAEPPDLVVFGLWTYTARASRRVAHALRRLSLGRVVVAELASEVDRDGKHGSARVWKDGTLHYFRQELSSSDEAKGIYRGTYKTPKLLLDPNSRVIEHGDWRAFLFLCGEVNLVQDGTVPGNLRQIISTCDLIINPGHTACSIHGMTLKRNYLGLLTNRRMLVHVANRHIPTVPKGAMLESYSGEGDPHSSQLLSTGWATARIHPDGGAIAPQVESQNFRLHMVRTGADAGP